MRWPESSYVLSLINDNKVFSLLLYGAFVLLKVLAVSHWNMATASAILASSSASDLILGALLSATPMALLITFSFVVFLWLSGHWERRLSPRQRSQDRTVRAWAGARLPILLAIGVLLPAVVLLPPATPVLACVGSALLLGTVARITSHSQGRALRSAQVLAAAEVAGRDTQPLSGRDTLLHNWKVLRRNIPTFYCGLALAVLVTGVGYSQLVSSVWLPHERVICDGCEHPVVGYVLDANGTDVTILVSGSRIVRIVATERVISREVCTIPYSWPMTRFTSGPKTVAQALGLRDEVPSCGE